MIFNIKFFKRVIRGIECDAFMSNRTDFKLPTVPNLNYSFFEICFLAVSYNWLKHIIKFLIGFI